MIKKIKPKLLALKMIFLTLFFNIASIGVANAQGVNTDFGTEPVTNVTDYVNRIIGWSYIVIPGLAVIMIIYAGYIYMTSQGNPERVNLAKEIIIGVITGIALLFLIRIILSTVGVQ